MPSFDSESFFGPESLTQMKGLMVSFPKRSMLEFTDTTRKLVVDSFDQVAMVLHELHGRDDVVVWVKATLLDDKFVAEWMLDKYRDVCFIDQYCNVLVHFENLSAQALNNGRVASIKV